MTHTSYSARIVRIGGVLLLISATVFGWISLPRSEETKFWNIGSYAITSVSARDDEDDEEGDDDRYHERSREREEEDEDDRDRYTIVESDMPIETVVTEMITTPSTETSSTPVQQVPTPSFEVQALTRLSSLGFTREESNRILGQFQGLYNDIASRYSTVAGRISVLQKLEKEANAKIADIEALSLSRPSVVYTSKEQSLRALASLASLRMSTIQSPNTASTNTPTQVRATQTARTTPTTVKTIAPTTSSTQRPTTTITSQPTVVSPPPAVNTRTAAS